MPDLTNPASVMRALSDIENDLARRQNNYEDAARKWHNAKREVEKTKATALLTAVAPSVTEKKAKGVEAAYSVEGAESEAEYVALKSAIEVLTTRATICQSILRAQGRS